MRSRTSLRLGVERLEDRTVPAVTASVINGSLVVKDDGSAASNIAITASDTNADGVADTFTVADGSTAVGTFNNVTRDVVLRLGGEDDTVSIDLGGLSAPRGIAAALGNGTNSLSIDNGTVKGSVSVLGGSGTDTVTLGGTKALTVNGSAALDLGDAANDVLHLRQATVQGYLLAFAANNVTLDAGSTVVGSVFLVGGTGGNTVNLNGTIEGSAVLLSRQFGSTAGSTLNITGTVDGNVGFLGSNQTDKLSLSASGSVGGSLIALLGGGDDTAAVSGTVTNNLVLDGGAGNDALTISGAVGNRTVVTGGAGDDTLTITGSTAKLTGAATVNMGAGNDKVTLDDSATITTLLANGGSGTDTFVGTRTRNGLTLVSFEA
jgi:hypothetical protein